MKKIINEFKAFISKGNVVDLSVATIMGAAFSTIVTSFTNGIIMPLISLLFQVENLDALKIELQCKKVAVIDEVTGLQKVVDGELQWDHSGCVYWQWGTLFAAIINFLIIAIFLFILIKIIASVRKNLNFNDNMIRVVQAKLDKDEKLNQIEEKWLAKFSKKNPDKAPKKKDPNEPKVEPVVELTTTEKLLTEILGELKKNQEEK